MRVAAMPGAQRLLLVLTTVIAGLGCEGDAAPPATTTTVRPAAAPATNPARPPVVPSSVPEPRSEATTSTVPPAPGASDAASLTRNLYFVLDGSGSMDEDPATRCGGATKSSFPTKIAAARWAIGEFLAQVPAEDRLGLYVFDRGGQREVVPLGTGNRPEFLAAVKAVYAAGGTPLAEAIVTGVDKLAAQRDVQLGYGDFRLVVVTDGEATGRRLEDGTEYALKKRIPIYTIGFCVGRGHTLFKHSVAYRAANSPAELRRGLEETLGELDAFDMKSFEAAR
jgi:hypothetical protein